MKLRPVEEVLLQTLEDIDPGEAARLKAELYDEPSSLIHESVSELALRVLPLLLAGITTILGFLLFSPFWSHLP
jgi:hypothetical protein